MLKSVYFLALLVLVGAYFHQPDVTAQEPPDSRQLEREQIQRLEKTGKRIALVIGNGAYTNAPPLKNPPNDARDMTATLKELGFDVASGINVNQREMKRLIREFGQKLKAGGSGLFYYAGHGVQSKGRNYLIPVEADIQSEAEVEDAGVDVNLVLSYMDDAQNGLNIMILDACRNNPFARSFRSASSGLAQVDAPTGTLIAYATAPGRVASDGIGQNGLYTSELLKQMRVPGLSATDMFMRVRAEVMRQTANRQVPWEASSLVGAFYFMRAVPAPVTEASNIGVSQRPPLTSDPQQYYARSLAHLNRGEFDAALTDINRTIELSPAFAQAYAVRAGIHHLKNDLNAAIVDSNKAIELHLNHEAPYLVRGASYNVQGNYDQALADFNQAIQINPQSGPAYSGRGVSYNGKGEYDKAIADYTRGLSLAPNEVQTYYNRGAAYFQKKDYDHALADFDKAIQLNPGLAVAYNYRALVYEKKGDIAKAEADRKRYRELYGID
ncbi:MAG TPA: caspase family protein [Pyrinomonadaceae bacterium]|nr:caspase family protein [Pyrinomonadaceae bacterium]